MGEKGVEVFVPRTAGMIISNSTLHNAYTRGSSSMASHHSSSTSNAMHNVHTVGGDVMASHHTAQYNQSSTSTTGSSESRVVIAHTFNIQAMDLGSFTAPKSRAEIARAIGMSAAQTQHSM